MKGLLMKSDFSGIISITDKESSVFVFLKQRRNFFSVDKLFLNFSKARDFSRISL